MGFYPGKGPMPWHSTDAVNERLMFVVAHQDGLFTMSELCERYGISRETGYTWLRRYRDEGPLGLIDRSHAPKGCPHRLELRMEELLVKIRTDHPTWGPRKLLAWLALRRPMLALPAASTVGDLLKRKGLVKRRRLRRGGIHSGRTPLQATGTQPGLGCGLQGSIPNG
jgi:putative transposase